ncbi:MAG: 2-oxoacid:acceptor oxidoreductase family protein [Desulfobacterales bacterium]|nr:2-oxoacid:acceptor oxidoreductase family protein [Desulfobacterales bacterium]
MINAQDEHRRTKEIILTGFGGQGIILAGRILGEAAALGDHRESTFIQSYGPESRGGACSAQVIVSDDIIHYPYVKHPDILICMSQVGYEKFIGTMKPNGILLIDQDLVHPRSKKQDFFSIPATRMAEELGHKMMANIIMLGFLTAVTKVVSLSAAQKAVSKSVPEGTKEINIHAFNRGCDYGQAKLKGRAKKAIGQTGAIL